MAAAEGGKRAVWGPVCGRGLLPTRAGPAPTSAMGVEVPLAAPPNAALSAAACWGVTSSGNSTAGWQERGEAMQTAVEHMGRLLFLASGRADGQLSRVRSTAVSWDWGGRLEG